MALLLGSRNWAQDLNVESYFCLHAGPRIFAVPGDVLDVIFRNNLNYTVNVVPSGAVTNSTESAEPGQTITYQWTVTNQVCKPSYACIPRSGMQAQCSACKFCCTISKLMLFPFHNILVSGYAAAERVGL